MTGAMSEHIDITGLPPHQVLRALVNNARPLGMGFYDPHAFDRMTDDQSKEIMSHRNSISNPHDEHRYAFDYVWGRPIKCNLSDDSAFDPRLYDLDQGPGSAQRAIDALRNETIDDNKTSSSKPNI